MLHYLKLPGITNIFNHTFIQKDFSDKDFVFPHQTQHCYKMRQNQSNITANLKRILAEFPSILCQDLM